MILSTPSELRDLIRRSHTVAVVGASDDPERPSYGVFAYLCAQGEFEALPVNPAIASVLGVEAYPSLAALAQERGAPDLVDVFRNPEHAMEIVEEAIAAGVPAIWFQLGVVNPEAIARADAAGMAVVADRCLETEHHRLVARNSGP